MTVINNELKTKLSSYFPAERMLFAEPMSKHTTFRIGGPADCLIFPANLEEIQFLLKFTKEENIPLTILGNGSNVLVCDNGIRGIVMDFGRPFAQLSQEGEFLKATAGMVLGQVSQAAAKAGLSGLEFAVGIPGSIGGAIFMNAGAYDGEMKNVVKTVTSMSSDGQLKQRTVEELALGYRDSIFQHNDEIILEVTMQLQAGDVNTIKEKMAGFTQRRISKQPLDLPSAGSTFKRPAGNFAGTLIEKTGLKGFAVGGAEVSPKHAGFVVNTGNATAADVLQLINEVVNRVEAAHGITLTPEVRILGEQ